MSEIPDQLNINAPVSGQIAIGDYNVQIQNVDGCNITVYPPGHVPLWERNSEPATIKFRPPSLFLDRISEIQVAEDALQASQPVNLSGMVGIGKSTLIKQIAHLVKQEQYPNGIFYLSARQLKLEDLLQCLFSGFYRSNTPVKPDRAQLQEALKEVKALVVIDDLELDQDEIQIVLDIAPGCLFLIASTLQILRDGSKSVRLNGLPEGDAVTLFEQELGRILEEKERLIVCEINEMLKGHPESLRWLSATSREDKLDLEHVREKLKVVSMQGFFQESVQSLPDRQKKLLAILSAVESRALPQEHLAALLPEEPVQLALNNLEARGLILTEQQTSRVRESFSGVLARFGGLAQWEELVTRHFVNWLAQNPSRQSIEQVRDTLWVLLKKAANRKDWSAVISLGRALEPFFIVSGYWRAWYEILQYILQAARGLANHKLEGWTLHQLGSRSLGLGEKEQATALLKQAASIRQAIGDQSGLQLTQHNLSLVPDVIPVTGHQATMTTATTSLPSMLPVAIGIAVAIAAVLGTVAFALSYKPRPPAPIQPSNEFLQEIGQSPAFEWQRVFAGSTYQIQVDDQQDFSSPIYDQTVSGTGNTPDLPLGQGVYYWRVRATSRFKRTGNWSETRQFTISIPPGLISLLGPANQSVETKPDALVFSWSTDDNAANYQIQIDNDPDFSSPESDSTIQGTEYSLAEPLSQDTYSWRVRAVNVYGTPGEWSEAAKLVISIPPVGISLTEPSSGSKLEDTTSPDFQWESDKNATNYQIQVDDNSDFSSPEFEDQFPETSFSAPASLSQGEYYWHVRGINEFGTAGDWSETWDFILSIPPAPPTLLNPANDFLEETTTTPSLEWTSVDNAANYEIQLDDNESFDSPNFGDKTSSTNLNPPDPLEQGTYSWRVRGLNTYDTAGEWSVPWKFTISIAPEPPSLIAPSDNTKLESTDNPSFSWQNVLNADQYELQVDNSDAFDSPEYDTTESNTSRDSNVGFDQGIYYWRVRALNPYGTAGPWSSSWQFIISIPPDTPILLQPAEGALIEASQPTLGWDTATNADYYQLQVDSSSDFSSPDYDKLIQSNAVKTDPVLPQGALYWRVRAFNPYDTPGDWSPAWQFTLSIPPATPRLSSPARASWVPSTTLSFSWTNTTNASKYLVQVDNDPNFSAPEYQAPILDTRTPNVNLREGRYFWRVQAYNSYGTAGNWSQVWDFTISIPPAAPILAFPQNQSLVKAPPRFGWHGDAISVVYEIQIDNVSNFTSPEIDTKTASTVIQINNGLVPQYVCGHQEFHYYWRVRAFNRAGIPGPWSLVRLVIVGADGVC